MKKVIPVILGILDVILLGVIIVSAATGWRIASTDTAPNKTVNEPLIKSTDAVSDKDTGNQRLIETAKPTEKATEAPTEKAEEKATEKPAGKATEKPAKLPYEDSLGKPQATDFAWLVEAANGERPSGAKSLSKDDIIGKWKGEFLFDGIWEMVYITIDRDGGITAQPYQINYGGGWEDESSNDPYVFSGSFSDGGVSASGKYGKMSLDSFYEVDGTQYGVGKFTVEYSGDTVPVGLIRP